MAIIKGAKKAYRSSLRKRVFNMRRKTVMHDVTKEVRTLIAGGKRKEAEALMPAVYKALDKAAKRGVIKKTTAARKKSRITAALAKVSA